MSLFNPASYLERLELQAPTKPSLAFLKKLQFQHLHKIPFENLDIHLKVPIVFELNHLFQKIILQRRGGFCYELNGLFFGLLQALGYDCWRVSARVYDSPRQYSPAYDHMALVVQIDQQLYLTDVGFGEFSLAPVHLQNGVSTNDGMNTYLVDRYYGYYRVNLYADGKLTPAYIFKIRAEDWEAFSPRCQYHQQDPDSHFQKGPVITKLSSAGRVTLTNLKFKQQDNTLAVPDTAAFASLLYEHFNLSWMDLQARSQS